MVGVLSSEQTATAAATDVRQRTISQRELIPLLLKLKWQLWKRSYRKNIGKLIGTTRTTIAAIRDRSHWNIANITPKDPVTLGLTSQRELDAAVAKAAKRETTVRSGMAGAMA